MKKLLGILLTALLLVNLLGVSARAEGNAIDFTEEPYEIHFLYRVAMEGADQDKVEKAISDLALKEINMTVKLIPVTLGAYGQQLQLILASGEPLDVFPALPNNFADYIESQYILNMKDYIQYAPDAVEILGDDAYAVCAGDFMVGLGLMKERGFPLGLVVRKDIFEALGYSVEDFNVNTDDYSSFDQITEMFAKVQETYPGMVCLDGTGMMGGGTLAYVDNLGNYYGVLENYGQTTTVTNWYESEQFKTFCEIARKWFLAGYTSSDIAVNQDSGEVKMKAGNCFSFISSIKPNTAIEKKSQTGYDVVIIPLGSAMKSTNSITGGAFVLANASKNPVKAMQFMNWMYKSAEFNDLLNWGIEGLDWVETEDGLAAYPEGVDSSNVGYHNDFGWAYPNQFAGHAWVGNPPDIWEQYKEYNESMIPSKGFGFTFDPVSVANELAQLGSVFDQYNKDLIFGAVEIEPLLSEFNQALYDAGLQTVIDEKQRQLNEWLALHN